MRLFCTLVGGAISLVWTTRGFYRWFEGFSMLKILMPLFVPLVIYYCCSLIVAPHIFLQVRGNYIRCILWYIVCVVDFPISLYLRKYPKSFKILFRLDFRAFTLCANTIKRINSHLHNIVQWWEICALEMKKELHIWHEGFVLKGNVRKLFWDKEYNSIVIQQYEQ